jgi:Zn-dependent protease
MFSGLPVALPQKNIKTKLLVLEQFMFAVPGREMRVELKPGAFLVAAIAGVVAPSLKLAALLLASLLLHELGHAAAAGLCGAKVKAIGVDWMGTYIRRENDHRSETNLATSLSGPLVNLVIAAIAIGWLSQVNFMLAICNLIPLPHSDGARAWRAISASASSEM